MLTITIPAVTREDYNEETNEFVYTTVMEAQTLQLEHSLVSISKWESKWCKAFLTNKEKTHEETIDYIRCMTITQNVKPEVYQHLTQDNIMQIKKYIEAPMTATYFSEDKNVRPSRELVTSELIYYWMIALNVPIKFEKWHINRLLTQIRVCNIKSQPPKKRSRKEIISRNAALNEARRKQFNTKG